MTSGLFVFIIVNMVKKDERMRLISVHSYKGGVGRSTIAALIGFALSKTKQVCMVDLDLLAPGLHHLFGLRQFEYGILDYMMADPTTGERAASPQEVCHSVSIKLADGRKRNIHLIPGRPDLSGAHSMQTYLLADYRAGLVQARLKVLFREIQRDLGIDVFILDTSPSFFGASGMVRGLVDTHRGASVYISTPTWQDLGTSLEMLKSIAADRKKDEPAVAAEAYILNRCPDWLDVLPTPRGMSEVIQMAEDGIKIQEKVEAVEGSLKRFKLALIRESNVLNLLSRVPYKDERVPSLEEVLPAEIDELAKKFFDAADRT